MKRVFSALGRALFYLMCFLGPQTSVAVYATMLVELPFILKDQEPTAAELTNIVNSITTLISLAAGLVTLLVLCVLWFVQGRRLTETLPIRRCAGVYIGGSLLLGVGLCLLTEVALNLIPFPQEWMQSYMEDSALLGQGNPAVDFIAVVLVAPVAEEVIFRGLVYTRLKSGMPAAVATLLTSLVFAALHGQLLWMTYTFVLSLVLIWILERGGSLLLCIFCHMAFNFIGQMAVEVDLFFVLLFGLLATAAGWLLFTRRRWENTTNLPAA